MPKLSISTVREWWGQDHSNRLLGLVLAGLVVGVVCLAVIKFIPFGGVKKLPNSIAEDYRERTGQLSKEAKNNAKNAKAQSEYATALYVTGKYSEAAEQYKKAISADPGAGIYHNNLANVYRDQGKYEDAVREYDKAISLDAKLANAYINLANMRIFNMDNVDEGIAVYEKALDIMPGNPSVLIQLGLAYEKKGDIDAAKESYRKVLAIKAGDAAATANLKRLETGR